MDYLTGYEITLSLFYLIPLGLITWFTNQTLGIMVSFINSGVWLVADLAAGQRYFYPAIYFWNSLIRLGFFLAFTLLFSSLRKALAYQTKLARTDPLTGAVNSRFFGEILQTEINRLQRYKRLFSIAYIDLDNFKMVNDKLGHSMGDRVLKIVVSYACQNLRKTDIFARLGGDEFALLLPETNQEAARIVLSKLQAGLLKEMQERDWPITFSIGVVTCIEAPPSTDEIVRIVDNLMYGVKREGKNSIQYSTYPSENSATSQKLDIL